MTERVYQRYLDVQGDEFVDNGKALLIAEKGKERLGNRVRNILIAGGIIGGGVVFGGSAVPLSMRVAERFSSAPAGYIDEQGAAVGVLISIILTLTGMIVGSEVGDRLSQGFLGSRNRIKLAAS